MTLLQGQTFTFKPILFGIAHSSGGAWQKENDHVMLAGWGAAAWSTVGPFEAWAELVMTRYWGLIPVVPNTFTPEQGLAWAQFASHTDRERDTHLTNMKVSYQLNRIRLEAGKYSRNWGPGLTSLFLSNKPPPFAQFGFDWEITDRIRINYFHGKLHSDIVDSLRTYPDGIHPSDERMVFMDRYIAGHRLDWTVIPGLELGISEIVIYGGREMDLNYTLPFVLYYSMQTYLGDTDNVELGADVTWRPIPTFKLYGVLFIDDWDFLEIFKEINNNKIGMQAGMEWQHVLHSTDQLNVEYNWTDHRVYRHRFEVNDAYNSDSPLGFWGGPHAQAFLIGYGINQWNTKWMISYTDAKRGQVTDEMRSEYSRYPYTRFTGPMEKLQILQLALERPFFKNWAVEIGFQQIRWTNPGFDPYDPSDDDSDGTNLPTLNRTSFTLALYYNFRYPGHGHPYQNTD